MADAVLSLDAAVDMTRTGDLWLFRGRSAADHAIRAVTNAPVNHVGMAVVLDDLPPLMWHAELGRGLTDVWTGSRHRGVQLHDLRAAVQQWAHRYGQRAWLRQLDATVSREMEDALLRTIARLDGTPFPATAALAGRWVRGRVRRAASAEFTYCAEVVAATYQAMGLLEKALPTNFYDPGSFWSGDRLVLAGGARLGAEIRVDVPPPDPAGTTRPAGRIRPTLPGMTEMSMNKVIHGAFRRDLDRFLAALGSFRAGDQKRADELNTAWANFDDQLTYHHEGEHETAWPALQKVGVSPDLLATMDAEHDAMAQALVAARAAMAELVRMPGREQADKARAALEELRTVTVAHLDHEEAEIEQVYLDSKDHPAVVEMAKTFARVSPARGGRFFAWLLDGASPDERAALSSTVPAPVLRIITGIFGRGYKKNVAPVWSR